MGSRLSAPVVRGGLLALLAASLFGVSTPLVQLFGVGLGAFTTAALLYLGAAVAGLLLQQPAGREARLQRRDWPRLLAMAGFGAILEELDRKPQALVVYRAALAIHPHLQGVLEAVDRLEAAAGQKL